ncbi:MAG TPA: NAD(P)-dependent oxidoreductase [Gemmatimonadaceae bacterium]|jgi:nucleoside-diphosphate-sugar epimerase|nr:NAD(P)-dependent oxidoreductase [Gemmatimonadaceae bacterium]
MLRIFVAGGTGVLGRRVIPELLASGFRVTASARSEESRSALKSLGAEPVEMNLFDAADVKRAVGEQDVIVNLATHVPPSTARALLPGAWRENDRIRTVGAANLAAAAKAGGADALIQESFAPIYEDGGDKWIDETWPVRPARYNKSTLEAERAATMFTRRGGRGVILRFAYFYGADGFATREMIEAVRKGVSPLVGAPDAYYSTVSHDDAAMAVLAALHAPSGIYNVSDDEPLTRQEWLESLAKTLGVRPPRMIPGWVSALAGSKSDLLGRSQRLSTKKLQDVSAWRPTTPSIRDAWPTLVREIAAGSS